MESNLYFNKDKRPAPKIRDTELLLRDLGFKSKVGDRSIAAKREMRLFDPQILISGGASLAAHNSPPSIIKNLTRKAQRIISPK